MLLLASIGFALVAVGCFVLVLIHAFKRSVGTGVMVLLIPAYNVFYGFRQFEHAYKGLILAGWLGSSVAALTLRAVALVPGG
jgi:benzodiazapine receptor